MRSRLLRDARAAAVLKHPNIVGIHDIFEDGARAYVVMEYVEGDSLSARLKANPLPDAATILKVLRQMADALDYTHARGVIHRDIKPANVMIDSAGTAKIMDFGIARISDARTCTPTGMVMGTVEYMAPEQIRGETVDGRADQFALAAVAYQMMTGSTMFGPHTLATLTYKIVNEAPPSACTRNSSLPRDVDAVLSKALAKNPSGRFANCCEFVGALAQAFSGAPTVPVLSGSVAVAQELSESAGPARKSGTGVLITGVVVVCLGGALVMAVWKPWNRTPPTELSAVAPPVATPLPAREPLAAPPVTKLKVKPEPTSQQAKPNAGSHAVNPVIESRPPIVPPPPVSQKPVELPPEPKTGTPPAPFSTALQRFQEQMKSRDFPGVIQSLTKALAIRPDYAPAYYNRGVANQNMEHNEAAIQNFSEAIRLAPDMALAYSARGACLVRLRKDPEALIDFQRALQLKPGLAFALNGRGGIYFRRKQYRMALADYDAAIQNNPGFIQAYVNRARAREAVGDFAGAAADKRREAELRKQ